MVRSGATIFACAAVAVLFIALLSGGTQASHGHFDVELRPPARGTTIHLDVAPEYDYSLDYRFTDPGEMLAGHFEPRDVAFVEVVEHYADWNHTLAGAYDLSTGLLLGHGRDHSFSDGWPASNVGPLEYRYDTRYLTGQGPSTDVMLPESLLWGRSFWPGESWTVHELRPYCVDGGSAGVTTQGEFNGSGFENISIVVSRHCASAYGTYATEWTLRFEGRPGTVADERILRSNYTDVDGVSWTSERVINATIEAAGGPHVFGFDGRADVRFWASRDQSMRYDVGDVFPADGGPHALFDIREAGTYALGLDDEAVRIFLSGAEGLRLLSAYADTYPEGDVDWRLTFGNGGERVLHVELEGVKRQGLPLVVIDHTVRLEDDRWRTGPDVYDGETAFVGDMARRTDAYFEAHGLRPSAYSWSDRGWGGPPGFSATGDDPTKLLVAAAWEEVYLDSSTGIVVGQVLSEYGIGL